MSKKVCNECGTDIEEVLYKYKGNNYCFDCLETELILDGKLSTNTSTTYFIDGEFIGTAEINGEEEIAKEILEYYEDEIKEVK